MTKLRDYQVRAVNMLYKKLREGKKKLLWVMPTGAGKSTVTAFVAKQIYDSNKRLMFIVHSEELVKQFANRLKNQFGLYSGIVMAGHEPNYNMRIQSVSLMTAIRRKNLPEADAIFIDEAHRSKAKSYEKLIEKYPNAKIIGLTATPFRMDGKPLGDIYEDIVHPVRIQELIKKGFLVPSKPFVPSESVDMKGVKTVAGDYAKTEMYDKFRDNSIINGVVENYLKLAKGKKAIVFNVNVKHSIKTHQRFLDHGVASAHIDGTTNKQERRKLVQDFANGKVQVLNSVDIFKEGFDIPDTECVILNRATKSYALFVQMVGRGLRPAPEKKECIVIDHGMNHLRFGHVEHYDMMPFDLGKKMKKKDPAVKRCKKCSVILKAGVKVCPNCSYKMPEITREEKEKMSVESQGFVVLSKEASIMRKLQKIPNKDSDRIPLHYLRIAALSKGYNLGWAYHQAVKHPDFKKETASRKLVFGLLQLEEMKEGTYNLYLNLKRQRERLKKQGIEKPKVIQM